ncbi:MAG: FN3 associated domain-containing protein, partial [Candidatus Odinarchaeota archaeon]
MISNPNAGAVSEVFYTVDESDPRDGGTLYTAPIDLDGFSGI